MSEDEVERPPAIGPSESVRVLIVDDHALFRRGLEMVLAQEPATCVAPSMPRAAIERGGVHLVLPPDALTAALVAFVTVPGTRAILGLGERIAA